MAQISDLISNESIRGLHEFFNRQVDEKQITESYTKGLANELKKTFGNLAVGIMDLVYLLPIEF